jgi:predicted RNase H-like HicB family nuclease
MSSQWTAICERQGQGWVAYFGELPQAIVPGRTEAEVRANLEQTVAMLLSAGIGGADLGFDDLG